ncbi:replicative DNA helicase [Actinophytocola glycyrrhizae]|uniref:DNA 5'-3' helicase n=1 Tax=Actinophytocola glycyrrhizae TaxID=2044873 RepID=A0ABV9SFM1_9PSEU
MTTSSAPSEGASAHDGDNSGVENSDGVGLPHDIVAEQSTLGGMLLSTDAIADVVEVLHPRDLYRGAHRAIYDTILDLYSRHEPVNTTTVAQAIEKQGGLDGIGGASYLQTLAATVPVVAHTGHYAQIVAEKAVLRRLVEAGTEIARLGKHADSETDVDVARIVDQARARLDEVAPHHATEDFPELFELLQPAMDQLDAIASRGGNTLNIPTGFADLDAVTSGLSRGSLTIIGAHPGVGASTLALNFVRTAAVRHGIPAAYLSLDNPVDAVTQRLLSAEAKIRLTDMRSGRMSDDDWTRLARRMTEISEAPIVISRPEHMDITALTKAITELTAQKGVQLIVVDPLHLVTARRDLPYENREREIAEITRRLKRLALDTNIAIIATAQLSTNPGPRQPTPPRPSLADLRDSGTIAHVADYVLFINRPDAWERDDPRAGEADLILAKHRHGPTATIVAAHQLHYSRFADLAQR